MTMFSFNRVNARPDASARNPSTAASDRQPFAVRLASDVLVAAGILALFGLIAWILPAIGEPIGPKGVPSQVSTNLADLPYYALRSVFRMFVALFFSLVFTFIYGTAAARCRRLSRVLIPLLDILQSVPILGFLSATITIWMVLFPGSMLGVEAASIFAIFTSQAWNMAFSFTRSLTSEPTELDEAARSLQLTRWQRFWTLDVPNAMIPLLWNCMMSVGGGWFFLTASEMISVNNRTYALPGIGSFVAQAAAEENLAAICWAIVTMVLVVLLIDVLLWKPLTAWAEKFRITQSESAVRKTSVVLTIIRQSHIDEMVAWLFRPVGDLFDTLTRPLGRTGGRWAADVKSARSRALDVVFTVLVLAACAFGLVQLMLVISSRCGIRRARAGVRVGHDDVPARGAAHARLLGDLGADWRDDRHESARFAVYAADCAGAGQLPLELHVPVRHALVRGVQRGYQLGQYSADGVGHTMVHPVQCDRRGQPDSRRSA